MTDKKPTRSLIKGKELLSGREIIQDFVLMIPGSMDKYHHLCSVLNTFEVWSEESRASFLSQFFDSYDILDVNCSELVHKLCKIRWHTVPSQMRSNFASFLCALAITHVHHIKSVFQSFVFHFLPVDDLKEHPISDAFCPPVVVDDALQESLYALTHLCVQNVVSCNPLSTKLLLKCFVQRFPHIKQPTQKLLAFMRNLLRFADWMQDEEVSAEIWALIVGKLLHIDALCYSEHKDDKQRQLSCYVPPERLMTKMVNTNVDGEADPMKEKLNSLAEFILNYLGDGNNKTVIRDDDRSSFFQLLHRSSPEKLQLPTENAQENGEDMRNMPVEEGYEEELMAIQ